MYVYMYISMCVYMCKEQYNQDEINHMVKAIVLPNVQRPKSSFLQFHAL